MFVSFFFLFFSFFGQDFEIFPGFYYSFHFLNGNPFTTLVHHSPCSIDLYLCARKCLGKSFNLSLLWYSLLFWRVLSHMSVVYLSTSCGAVTFLWWDLASAHLVVLFDFQGEVRASGESIGRREPPNCYNSLISCQPPLIYMILARTETYFWWISFGSCLVIST